MPSDAEWTTLETYLGGSVVAGGKLKEAGTIHWNSPNTGADNSSGFTALPVGYRGYTSTFNDFGNYCFFWSALQNDASFAWGRILFNGSADVSSHNSSKSFGFSVRCVRD